MRKAFVYRIYPSKPQERRLEQVRETCRRFYNDLDCCVLGGKRQPVTLP